MQDAITREIIVKATTEQVYDALTNPEKIIKWFPNEIRGTLQVGEQTDLVFTKQNHVAPIHVVAATPNSYFSYRWVPSTSTIEGDITTMATTLVEFFIEQQSEGTKVTVKESGFSSLPPETAEKMFHQNSGGWEYMINRLAKLFDQA